MEKMTVMLSFLLLLFCSCRNSQKKIQPTLEKITESVYAPGIVKSRDQYAVYSTVNGLVSEVFVKEGDTVRKGQPIMRLVNTTAKLQTDQAKISAYYASREANEQKLRELEINIQLAKEKLDNETLLLQRQKNLWAQEIGTRNELDQRELAYKAAVNSYESARLRYSDFQKEISRQEKQAQKQLQIAETISADYTIRSENNGRVYSILKEKGEMVTPQQPVAVAGDADEFILELQVDEYDIATVRPGQKIVLNMDSYKGKVFEAITHKVNPLMNERSKSFTVEALFVTRPPSLYPNLTCEANIILQTRNNVLTIPRSCLLPGDFVELETGEKRKVQTGLKDYRKVEIVSGLTKDDIILQPE